MIKKPPNPIDKHIGLRVRMRRMMLGISQETLGKAIGLTFQQVQKYEKGTNRIGGSRMQQIATVLQVEPAFFFDGQIIKDGTSKESTTPDYVSEFMSTSYGLSLTKNFMKLTPKVRVHVSDLVESLAAGE